MYFLRLSKIWLEFLTYNTTVKFISLYSPQEKKREQNKISFFFSVSLHVFGRLGVVGLASLHFLLLVSGMLSCNTL